MGEKQWAAEALQLSVNWDRTLQSITSMLTHIGNILVTYIIICMLLSCSKLAYVLTAATANAKGIDLSHVLSQDHQVPQN